MVMGLWRGCVIPNLYYPAYRSRDSTAENGHGDEGPATTSVTQLSIGCAASLFLWCWPCQLMTDDLTDANRRMLNHLRDRVESLEEENEQLRERVSEVERLTDPDPGQVEYEELSRSQKVYRVRKALVTEATRTQNGKERMNYKDVRWLFDGRPSVGHTYDLMKQAADLDGFEYDTAAETHRITVDLPAVNDETLVHAANKAINGQGGVTTP